MPDNRQYYITQVFELGGTREVTGELDTTAVVTSLPTQVTNPTVVNVNTNITPNTEDSYALPDGTVRFKIVNTGTYVTKFNYVTGTATVHETLFPNAPMEVKEIKDTATITLFFQSPGVSQRLEITSWT